jgi:uncharacterized protein YndB with AHSA1/START domain
MSKKLIVNTDVPNEIAMTRVFDAPRRLVVKAMTTPELIKKWLGGVRATVLVAEVDFRVGGRYRYQFRNNSDGSEFGFVGEYKEVGEDRVVHSERFNDMPPDAIVTSTFTEKDGKTTLHIVMTLPNQEIRDMIVATGMSDGAGESYDKLEELVRSL